jgi:ATP-dependent DNA ligase
MVKTGDLNQKLEYHIYDVPVRDLSFAQRRNLLLALTTDHLPNIKIDHGKPCSTTDELQEFHKDSLDLGYEGTIVCDPNGKYDFGFRTSGKTKIKPRVTEEFECIDQYWNRGKMSKQTTLICKTKDGETFHVKLKGTAEQREEWAANFETDVKGKMITVEYRKKTKKQVPIEGVGVAIRDYE